MRDLRAKLRGLYFGSAPHSRAFRLALLVFDILAISFFVYTAAANQGGEQWVRPIELVVLVVIASDFIGRMIATDNLVRYLTRLTTIADAVVIATIFIPLLTDNLVFLRVLRALRLISSYRVLRDLRGRSRFFQRNGELIESVINLALFIFVTTELVFVFQHGKNPQITTFLDALYFTIASLTTTGYGDITLVGQDGRILAVLIMVLGVALFLRLLQTVFRPAKVQQPCKSCGLMRHDADASHCKHCGEIIHIPTEGE